MAMILDPFVSHFVEKLTTLAEDEVAMLLGVPGEIKALRRRLSSLQVSLVHAERRQFQEPEIKSWLNQLREVMYDADDILDEYVIQTERLKQGLPKLSARFFHPAISCFATCSLRHSVGNRMEGLKERIEGIKWDLPLTTSSHPTSSASEYHGYIYT
ncbi:putative disease resistance protein RGA4 [Cocos nucifera]|uniref:Putative disease resistance protein RGA4 n=1 Tax=Cocos nucifera TaxID=13894 RepID=A0A8K0N6K3_COCNU|nr:putative disease resistance protein RGA4 [Cocos nucifera]